MHAQQEKFVNARFVYASATMASSPKELEYMQRVGLFGEHTGFETFSDFEQTVQARGTGAMELLAVDLKRRGRYLARTLSFKDCTYEMREVDISKKFSIMHAECCDIWNDLLSLWTDLEANLVCVRALADALLSHTIRSRQTQHTNTRMPAHAHTGRVLGSAPAVLQAAHRQHEGRSGCRRGQGGPRTGVCRGYRAAANGRGVGWFRVSGFGFRVSGLGFRV